MGVMATARGANEILHILPEALLALQPLPELKNRDAFGSIFEVVTSRDGVILQSTKAELLQLKGSSSSRQAAWPAAYSSWIIKMCDTFACIMILRIVDQMIAAGCTIPEPGRERCRIQNMRKVIFSCSMRAVAKLRRITA